MSSMHVRNISLTPMNHDPNGPSLLELPRSVFFILPIVALPSRHPPDECGTGLPYTWSEAPGAGWATPPPPGESPELTNKACHIPEHSAKAPKQPPAHRTDRPPHVPGIMPPPTQQVRCFSRPLLLVPVADVNGQQPGPQ